MKKITAIILTLAVFTCIFTSCGGNQQTASTPDATDNNTATTVPQKTDINIDLSALASEMKTRFDRSEAFDIDSDMLFNLYGIAAEDVSDSACYMTVDGVFPAEVIMIKAKDGDAALRIVSALDKRIEEVEKQSENYDPENLALAKKCKTASNGLYVTMFLSPDYEEMTSLFNSKLANG